ncbi:hypothetical protein V866_002844 [Kwoniella sp. B9012]
MVITNRGGRISNLTTCTQDFGFHTFEQTAKELGLEQPHYEDAYIRTHSIPKPSIPLNPIPRIYQELDKVVTQKREEKEGEHDRDSAKKPRIKRIPRKMACENRFWGLELPSDEEKQLTAVLAYSEEDRTNDMQRLVICRSEEKDKQKRKENLIQERRRITDLFHSDRRGFGRGK